MSVCERWTRFGWILPLLIVVLVPSLHAGSLIVRYLPPANEAEQAAVELLKTGDGLSRLIREISDSLRLQPPLVIEFGGEGVPHFDSESGQVSISYAFVSRVADEIARGTDGFKTAKVLNILDFSVSHELSHAIIHQLKLPVENELAIDQLAALLLFEYASNGEAIVLDASRFLAGEAKGVFASTVPEEAEVLRQRGLQLLCLVSGLNAHRMAEFGVESPSGEKRDDCRIEYERTRETWWPRLEPVLP